MGVFSIPNEGRHCLTIWCTPAPSNRQRVYNKNIECVGGGVQVLCSGKKKEQSFCFYVLKFRFFFSSFLFRLSSYSLHGCQPVARVGVSSKIEK